MSDPCSNEQRFANIEETIKDIRKTQFTHSNDISVLKQERVKTEIYVKQIFERLDDLKELFISGTSNQNKFWQEIIRDLVKVIVTLAGGYLALKAGGVI